MRDERPPVGQRGSKIEDLRDGSRSIAHLVVDRGSDAELLRDGPRTDYDVARRTKVQIEEFESGG